MQDRFPRPRKDVAMNRILLGVVLTGLGFAAESRAIDPPQPMPEYTSSTLLHRPASVDQTSTPGTASPVPCLEPCAAPCPSACGPRTRIVFPTPIVTFRKTGTKVVEASCAAESCATVPSCQSCRTPVAPAPRMMTVLVPYTYYVQVPTYGVAPAAGYGAAPTAYGATPVTYGAPVASYGAAPVQYVPAQVYGAALPVS